MLSPFVHKTFEVHLGPLTLTGFGLAVALSFVISQVIAQQELERRGHHADANAVGDLILASILGTLIGGKVYYTTVITHDWHDLISRAGFVFWGGFIGAVLVNWIFIRAKKLSFARFADVGGICIAAGYSVGRTGCWAVGDDYGRPWNGFLAVQFPNGSPPSTAGVMHRMFGTPIPADLVPGTDGYTTWMNSILAVHPTQLYETALGFVMFLILWRLRDHKHAEGWLFGVYCVLAGLERFAVEFVRAKDDHFFGPLTAAQMIGIAIALAGVAVMHLRSTIGDGRKGIYA